MNSHRTWIQRLIGTTIICLMAVAAVNYYVDPLWCFSHTNRFNQVQDEFDERQQKTNRLTFLPFDYDTLILGSSISTFINQNDFKGLKAYNYSMSGMLPTEYAEFVEYAKKRKGGPFKNIVLGIDFFGSNAGIPPAALPPGYYIKTANEPLYRYKMLIVLDTLRHSINNIRDSYGPRKLFYYNRGNVRFANLASEAAREKAYTYNLFWYRYTIGGDYRYREVKDIFMELKKRNPGTNFMVYITPVTQPLFEILVEEGRINDLLRWVGDSVDAFGSVWSFMYLNPVTVNFETAFFDGHHFSRELGSVIAQKLMGNREIVPEFGIWLTRENVGDHIVILRKQLAALGKGNAGQLQKRRRDGNGTL